MKRDTKLDELTKRIEKLEAKNVRLNVIDEVSQTLYNNDIALRSAIQALQTDLYHLSDRYNRVVLHLASVRLLP